MTSSKSGHTYDFVEVIESTTDATQPGRELSDRVLTPYEATHPDVALKHRHHTPQTRDEFFKVLEDIAADTLARDGRPVLHLEIHSNEPGTGLSLAKGGDEVPWVELTTRLVAINKAARGNLVVVLAVCFGERLRTVFSHSQQAPTFGLVGPDDEISFGTFELAFQAFYHELLSSGDGDEAVRVLNVVGREKDLPTTYQWRSAEGAFRDHLHYVIERDYGSASKRQSQVEAAVTRLMKLPVIRAFGLAAIRKAAKRAVKTVGRETFEKMRDRYLMLDLFPEQRSRYSLTYEDCVPLDRLTN